MRYSLLLVPCLMLSANDVPVMGQSAAPSAAMPKMPVRAAVSQPSEKETTLPVRRVSLYKNGVGFFEQSGQVKGDELVRIDLTTAQLNDVLQSLTAVDLGDGRIAGGGYDAAMPLSLQLNAVAPGLGQDPTVMDFLKAIKGSKVEVRSGGGVSTGRVLNVEVRREPEGKGSVVMVERRYLSLITDGGGLRSIALTPSVEVRLLGPEKQEIGHYLQLLAMSHNPALRHLLLEDRGTGERELHVSYISAVPAWKSSYRILFSDKAKDAVSTATDSKDAAVKPVQTATLQGWAVVDNTSGTDWDDVALTLVSGAPSSFIQQISRPLDIQRPEIGMPMQEIPANAPRGLMGAMADPIGASEAESVPVNAGAIGGGGVQVHRTAQPEVRAVSAAAPAQGAKPVSMDSGYEAAAERSLAPQTTQVDMDDLFEYKLSKPITIRKGESATIPILQTEVEADRVTVWNADGLKRPMRALWLKNLSNLTLDLGSFSIVENGLFGGQGQIDLLHPNQREMVRYAADEAMTVNYVDTKNLPTVVRRIAVSKGVMAVHRRDYISVNYVIQNAGANARTVVIERARDKTMDLSADTPAAERTDDLDRFVVQAAANATTRFRVLESHTHPTHYDLAKIKADDLAGIIRESNNNEKVVATLQPLLDEKRRLAEVDKKLEADQRAMDEVKLEEKRIRDNIEPLKGSPEEQALSTRYAEQMNVQEDKMAALQKDREALREQRGANEKQVAAQVGTLTMNAILAVL